MTSAERAGRTASTVGFATPEALASRIRASDDATVLTLPELVEAHLDLLPWPASGETLARWRMLAEVAAHDLSLAKLYEGHTDALAILHELAAHYRPEGALWGTWCAEPPNARLALQPNGGEEAGLPLVRLHGTKAWCSGAAIVSHALVSCWDAEGKPCLAVVAMKQPAVQVTDRGWQAVGMAGSASVEVRFDGAQGLMVGQPGDYVARPGFWQGGAGIAACWYGGAMGIARALLASTRGARVEDPHRLAHLGAIDAALCAASATLRATAAWIDAHPRADAFIEASRARLVVETLAGQVLHHATRAMGAGPLCQDASVARAVADLPVYIRQSHAERDQAALARRLVETPVSKENAAWML